MKVDEKEGSRVAHVYAPVPIFRHLPGTKGEGHPAVHIAGGGGGQGSINPFIQQAAKNCGWGRRLPHDVVKYLTCDVRGQFGLGVDCHVLLCCFPSSSLFPFLHLCLCMFALIVTAKETQSSDITTSPSTLRAHKINCLVQGEHSGTSTDKVSGVLGNKLKKTRDKQLKYPR
nr:PREDICTED: uncharacterized protein LOC106703390 [Latimeria chalumnae]|eukprot:XP_014343624.1 PREDICTED: uncharacterized protein LOC106703390 [Latimeria chalumnae]